MLREQDLSRSRPRSLVSILFLACLVLLSTGAGGADQLERSLELSRPVRPWEFLSVVGTRGGLFGNESGKFEAWIYPLKILRDFRLRFHTDGHVVPAETLTRTIIVHPESTTVVYVGDTFTVRETLLVPVHEPGVLINLEIETFGSLEVEAVFQRDFQLQWPAALGGTYQNWDPALNAFSFGEEKGKFVALVGSPSATDAHEEYSTNYSASGEDSLRLGVNKKGRETRLIVIAASLQGRSEAEGVYRHLASAYQDLLQSSAQYYQTYLDQTVKLELPDHQLQQAYDWSRISMVQGLVANPLLGTGLVAGYRTSGNGQRPGFAWFFGRDALWTALALDAAGDFATTRAALEFLSQYQREDGKVPHEVSQAASFVPWFKDYPYPYASADATPLFIIAMHDYVEQSGDVAFAHQKWDNLWRANQFLRSTYDSQGYPQNFGFGHGWVEGGPLLPIKTELYQSGLGLEAIRALSHLARLVGKEDTAKELEEEFARRKPMLNQTFWSPDKRIFAFALDNDNQRVDELSVLSTVPLWFHLLEEEKVGPMLSQLADSDHATDWGMRIISAKSSKYNPSGYHFGTVWPLFTGWASVGEYRYHRSLSAYFNLRANALLSLDGSLGHVTEVLSGDYYQPISTSSPHQIWSAAMVVSPLLRGMLGLEADATARHLRFTPHVPTDWSSFAVSNIKVGSVALDFSYQKKAEEITLKIRGEGNGDCTVDFSPALSLRTEVAGVEMNGRPVAFHIEASDLDQHVTVSFSVSRGSNKLRIHLRNDFGLSFSSVLPPLGSPSRGLRVLTETWAPTRDSLTLEVSGSTGKPYELGVSNPSQIASVEGAELIRTGNGETRALIRIPASQSESYLHQQLTFHFSQKRSHRGK